MTADARSPEPLGTQPHETQWPRWEIFKQDTAARPLQAVGSVHAGDPEHALLTARNVFVRRPAAVSLWAVREDDLLTATPEALATHPELLATPGEAGRYQVGIKATAKRSMTFVDLVGAVEASGPGDALGQARALHPDALAWQVFAEAAAVKSDASPETVESWFAPARDKTYKQQQFYGVIGRHVSAFKQEGKQVGKSPQAEETP